MSQAGPLKHLQTGEIREQIAYTIGSDPTRYTGDRRRNLKKKEIVKIAERLQPEDSDYELVFMNLAELYEHVCNWAGGEYQKQSGNQWGLCRDNLKLIHRSIGAEPPREVVEA